MGMILFSSSVAKKHIHTYINIGIFLSLNLPYSSQFAKYESYVLPGNNKKNVSIFPLGTSRDDQYTWLLFITRVVCAYSPGDRLMNYILLYCCFIEPAIIHYTYTVYCTVQNTICIWHSWASLLLKVTSVKR